MNPMPPEVRLWRRDRRAELVASRVALGAEEHHDRDAAITRLLIAAFPLLVRMTVGFYWPFNNEFDPRFAIRHWRDRGARAALPVVVEKSAPLEFRAWWPGAPMARGVYNLPFPDGTAILRPDALLIPPVGFDLRGFRLGYGGGYFDRTLAAMDPQPLKIGVGYELSRMPTIQPQPHDIPMDFIVTEAGVHVVGAGGLELLAAPASAGPVAEALVLQRTGGQPGVRGGRMP